MASRKSNLPPSSEADFQQDNQQQRRSKETPRSLDFRRRKNQVTMSNVKSALDIKLFKNMGGPESFSKSINFSTQNRSIQVPISTRGIGLVINQNLLRTSKVLPSVQPPIPALYRTALSQFEAKLTIANTSQHQMSLRQANVPARMPIDLQNAITSRPRQLASVAAIINQVGNVTVNETTFVPRITTQEHFNLSISNLRGYVDRMSDLATPLEERQLGYSLNSIPSAIWSCDPAVDPQGHVVPGPLNPVTLRIFNPNEIIGVDYDIQDILQDFRDVDVYFERLGRKMLRSIDEVEFSDRGCASQLVSTVARTNNALRLQTTYDAGGDLMLHTANGDADAWYAQRCTGTQDALMGIIGLLGEVSIHVPAQFIEPTTSFRSPFGAAQAFDQSWMTTVESML